TEPPPVVWVDVRDKEVLPPEVILGALLPSVRLPLESTLNKLLVGAVEDATVNTPIGLEVPMPTLPAWVICNKEDPVEEEISTISFPAKPWTVKTVEVEVVLAE